MKNFCEKHHLGYNGDRCPMCEKERIASFKVSKHTVILPGQASRESYFEDYRPIPNDGPNVVVLDHLDLIKPDRKNYNSMSDNDLADLLASKFGNVSIKPKKIK